MSKICLWDIAARGVKAQASVTAFDAPVPTDSKIDAMPMGGVELSFMVGHKFAIGARIFKKP